MSSYLKTTISKVKHEALFYTAFAAFGLLAGATSGCGKQAFTVQKQVSRITGAGTFDIAPKVDFVMAVDDTGGMSEAFPSIAQQVPVFLNSLQNRGWNYNFATVRLTTPRQMTEIIGSKFDIGWGSEWLPPYPGAPFTTDGSISPFLFRKPQDYSAFLTSGDINNSLAGKEPGFDTILDALATQASGTGLLRQDALTVVLVVSTGDDTSRVNLCQVPAGFGNNFVACESQGAPACASLPPVGGNTYTRLSSGQLQAGACSSKALSLAHYEGAMRGLKGGGTLQTKVYSAVAPTSGNCSIGGYAFAGQRYTQLANDMGGQAYNVCTQPISSVLDSLTANLQIQRGAFRTRYIFIEMDPDPTTIEVTITRTSGVTETIAEDPNNGWTYAGKIDAQAPVYAIDSPVPLNLQSGFAIELHGAAKLIGDDAADVRYKPAGVNDSVSR